MRAHLRLWSTVGLVACGGKSASNEAKTEQAAEEEVEEDVDSTQAGVGFDGTDVDDSEEEEEEDTGSVGSLGDPATGEVFQFVWADACDFRWDLSGEIVACSECDLAFELGRILSADSTCSGGEDDSGTLEVRSDGIYFRDLFWGAVFAHSQGYVTWNSVGYAEGGGAYYYIGHLSH